MDLDGQNSVLKYAKTVQPKHFFKKKKQKVEKKKAIFETLDTEQVKDFKILEP